jgi:hypothetical protein
VNALFLKLPFLFQGGVPEGRGGSSLRLGSLSSVDFLSYPPACEGGGKGEVFFHSIP